MGDLRPLDRYRELISETWDVSRNLRFAANTRQLGLGDMTSVVFAEGRVVGYLEALYLLAPAMAAEAEPLTAELISDLTDLKQAISERIGDG